MVCNTMRSAVGYIRVSTIEQSLDGDSLDTQRASIEAEAERLGLVLEYIYSDEGVSGRRHDRDGLASAVAHTMRCRGVLIAFSMSRLSRSASLTHQVADTLRTTGCDLVCIHDQINTVTAGPCGTMMLGVLAAFAQHTAEQNAETTRTVLAHLRAQGRRTGGSLPYGYSLAPDGKHLIENFDEQNTIRRIREYFGRIDTLPDGTRSKPWSLARVTQQLDQDGIRTRAGTRWSTTQVHRVINAAIRPVICG